MSIKRLYNELYWSREDMAGLALWIEYRKEQGKHCFGVEVNVEASKIRVPKAVEGKFYKSFQEFVGGRYIFNELGG